MKLNKYIIPVVLLAGCIALPSCNDRLDIGQHGVTTVSNFYQTDADAEEAITACYDAWKGTFQPAFTVKNLISDDVNNGGPQDIIRFLLILMMQVTQIFLVGTRHCIE